MIDRRTLFAALAAGAMLPAGAGQTQEAWPIRPVRLIVPFPPGGPNDILARSFAEALTRRTGQPVVIDNRSGAGGVVGTDVVAKAAPDGYTLGVTSAGALAVASSLQSSMPYDTARDLAAVTLVATVPELLVVSTAVEARNLADLVRLAKARPGQLNYASSGNGSVPHLAGESLRFAAGIDIVHVPYRGAAPAVTDLIAGSVQMMFADVPVLLAHVQAGTLRALAQGGRERSPLLPELPTTAEAGFPQLEVVNWYGLVAPARTPPGVLTAIQAAAAAALGDDAVQRSFAGQGANPGGGSAEAFSTYIREETARWGEVVRRSGATVD